MHSPPGWQARMLLRMTVPRRAAHAVLASGHPVWGGAQWVGGMWVCPGRPLPMLSPHPASNDGQAGPFCPLPTWNRGHQPQLLGRFLVTILHTRLGMGCPSPLSSRSHTYPAVWGQPLADWAGADSDARSSHSWSYLVLKPSELLVSSSLPSWKGQKWGLSLALSGSCQCTEESEREEVTV